MADTPMKRCSRCGRDLPLDSIHFFKATARRIGFMSACKECLGYKFEASRAALDGNGVRRCKKCGNEYPCDAEHFVKKGGSLSRACRSCIRKQTSAYRDKNRVRVRDNKRRWDSENKEIKREHDKCYRKRHKDELREKGYAYYQKNKNRIALYNRQYYLDHRDHVLAYASQWQKANLDKVRIKNARWGKNNRNTTRATTIRKRARRRSLPNKFTAIDWQRALDYLNGCCAVCGRPLRDLFGTHKPAADHWIPLTDPRPDNPGTVPTNIVPLCHGVGGCNNRKSNRDPIEFLETEFGKRRARETLKRVNAYFEWVARDEQAADAA